VGPRVVLDTVVKRKIPRPARSRNLEPYSAFTKQIKVVKVSDFVMEGQIFMWPT
jgi:hypothetical protein